MDGPTSELVAAAIISATVASRSTSLSCVLYSEAGTELLTSADVSDENVAEKMDADGTMLVRSLPQARERTWQQLM